MFVFAPVPFRNAGIDYPYGYQDITSDTLARTLVAAGLVIDATRPSSSGGIVPTGTPDGTKFLGDDLSWKSVPAPSAFNQTLLNAVVAAGAGPSFSYPGGGPSNFNIACSNWNSAVATIRRSTNGGSSWTALSGDYSSFSANGACVVNESAGVLLDVLVVGTPGAAMTATLSR
jgi:hypothetical protein